LKVTELIAQMQRMNPKLLRGIPEKRAARLIRSVFEHINDTLARTKEGVVPYGGLGRFRVRKVEREVKGERVIRTQIIFRRAEPATGKGEIRRRVAGGFKK